MQPAERAFDVRIPFIPAFLIMLSPAIVFIGQMPLLVTAIQQKHTVSSVVYGTASAIIAACGVFMFVVIRKKKTCVMLADTLKLERAVVAAADLEKVVIYESTVSIRIKNAPMFKRVFRFRFAEKEGLDCFKDWLEERHIAFEVKSLFQVVK